MTRTWIDAISLISDRWWHWCLMGLIEATLLLVLVSSLWFCVRRRVSPQVGYLLFLLVPLKLMLPLDVSVPDGWIPPIVVMESKMPETNLKPPDRRADLPIAPAMVDSQFLETAAVQETIATLPASREIQSAKNPVATVTTQSHSLSLSPIGWSWLPSTATILMVIWFAGAFGMIARFVWAQFRFWNFVRCLPAANNAHLERLVSSLCERIGIRRKVKIVVNDAIAVPSICGCFWPTLLLPTSATTQLSAEQLQWVLLHELAHIRRWDLPVVALQRLLTITYWFNPSLWIANRVIHALREYACDDLAITLSDGTSIDSSEALLQILKTANQGSQKLSGALGVFGLDARASCVERLKRLLDTDRTIRTKLDRWTVCGLLLLAGIVLPRLHAADKPAVEVKQTTAPDKVRDDQPKLAKAVGRFDLLVVDSDHKPIPHASVEIRTNPHLREEHVLQGKFRRSANYGTQFIADEVGQLSVKLPDDVHSIQVDIETPKYGPYWAEWTSENDSQFTAELDSAWSAGGVIVDPDGKPVEGVIVHPRIDFKKRPGDATQLGTGAVLKTDQAGRWHFDVVPASNADLYVEINHPDYRPLRQSLPRKGYGIEFDQQPTRQIVLDRGITIRGTVTDDAGTPIAGALIRTKFMNDVRKTTTDEKGHYELSGCEERMARVVVSSKGKATDMQEVRINPDLEPVDFKLQPGGKVRIRVVDEQGRPQPKSRIFFQRWRGQMFQYFEFDHVNQYSDENGVWEWNEAPRDGFEADICPPQGMQLSHQTLMPRDEELTLRLVNRSRNSKYCPAYGSQKDSLRGNKQIAFPVPMVNSN
jgi:beta-lactamase regulating signal transducer with metallopeptidase domain